MVGMSEKPDDPTPSTPDADVPPADAENPAPDASPTVDDTLAATDSAETTGTGEDDVTNTSAAPADGPDDAPATESARRTVQASRARKLLALVAIGAIGAAGVTIAVSGGFDRAEKVAAPSSSSAPVAASAVGSFDGAGAGDCLQWTPTDDPDTDRQDLAVVPCAEPHRFEVAEPVDLSLYPTAEFGVAAAYPDSARFTALRDEHCETAVQDYTGGRFDPTGRYSIGLMFPSQAGWAAGERTIRCGIQQTGATSALQLMTGGVADQDQSMIWETGSCVGVDAGVPTDPVDCAAPHAFEVVSVVDLAAQFPGGLPSVEDQDAFLEPTCTQAADAYLGSPDALRNQTLTLFWDNVDASSWLAGSKRVSCSIGKEVEAGGFASIVGSARGEITIDGAPPVPPPAIPDGRSLPTPLPGAAPIPGN